MSDTNDNDVDSNIDIYTENVRFYWYYSMYNEPDGFDTEKAEKIFGTILDCKIIDFRDYKFQLELLTSNGFIVRLSTGNEYEPSYLENYVPTCATWQHHNSAYIRSLMYRHPKGCDNIYSNSDE
jgi:hypothetical protein